ncbi:cadherin-like beta sandwich domain-containing protein [Methanohalophilus portucalensis]|nr:cadherin-like beta sandwich domain-containing protein [Methanohalophilus portucalensis]
MISGCADNFDDSNESVIVNNQTENQSDFESNDDENVTDTDSVQEKDDPEPDVKENDTFTIRVSSGGSGSSSKSSTPSVSVTPSGILEVDPMSVSNNTKINITVLYEVGESLNNGTVEMDIPSEFIVNNLTDIISISNNSTTVSENSKASYDANNVLSVENLNINKADFVNLTLTNYSVNSSGSYNFAASSMDTGKEMSDKVYATFTVYNDNAYLKNLSASKGDVDPSFDSTVYNYNTSVDYNVEQIDVKAILEDTKATLKVNDTTAASGDAATVTLNDPGTSTEIIIEVIAEDGETSKNYTINVSRSNSPSLRDASVGITEGSVVFSYEFYNETGSLFTYGDALASPYLLNNTSSTVTLVNESGALTDTITLEELGIDAAGNVSYQNVTEVGETFNIANIMQWGYPTNITLNLTGGQGEYTWSFNGTVDFNAGDINAFTLIIPGSITGQVTNTSGAPLEDVFVQIEDMEQYNASTNPSGIYIIERVPAGTYNVTAGIANYMSNTSESVVVNAAQPTTGVNFELISTDSTLGDLQVNPGTLDPAFDALETDYNVSVSHTVDEINLTAIPSYPQASITINNSAYNVGNEKTVSLQDPGESTEIAIVVAAEDQTNTSTYNVTVERAAVPTYNVTFNVTDGTIPIEGAQINISENTLTTNESGISSIDLINGTYDYNITAKGYYPENGSVTVEGLPVEIQVNMDAIPVIRDASVGITEGSVVFSYEFYNETGSLFTYGDALASPYLLNNTSSTVTLMNESGTLTDKITFKELGVDTVGNVSYQNVTEVGETFNIANVMQWGYPTNITLNLTGGQGEYTWSFNETVDFNAGDINAFTSIIPGSITGQVTNTSGAPLEDVFVQIEDMEQYNASTNPSGIYIIERVPAGTYNVTAGIADYMSNTSESVVVNAAQPTTGVNFELISTDSTLGDLQVNPGTLDPAFDALETDYNVSVSHTVDEINLTAILSYPQASITINNSAYNVGNEKTVALQDPGESTEIAIVVTAEDQTSTSTYNVTVERAAVPTYNVTFNVTDGTIPIEGAQINISENTLTTNESGISSIDLINGTYDYNITAKGYYPENGSVTVEGSPVEIQVNMDAIPVIRDASVGITEGSVVFSYEFYNETGSLFTYGDALASPYLLNNTSSTVTLVNESGALTNTITLEELGIDAAGNVSYQNVTEVGETFNIANIMQWGYPTNITLNLTGGQGEYKWVLEETINLTSSDIAAFMKMVSTPPDGDLLDAAAGSDFMAVLFTRDGDLYHKQIGAEETWSSEILVNKSASEGKIVVDSGDKTHVTYTTNNGTIAYRTMDNGGWTGALYIGSNNAGECYWPDVDVDSSNDPHIIYVDTMGDTAGTRNQPDLMYASLNNDEFNKVLLASGNYDRDWKMGSYPGEKPPQIAMDANDNRYYLYQSRSYSHDMFVDHSRRIDVVGANTESLGSISSNTNRFDIYDLKIVDSKLYALYRDDVHIKANEMNIGAAGQITSLVDKVVFDASSAYSLDVASSDIVIGSKDGDNLRVHYNGIPETATEINVKGDAVSIVHMGGSFYAAYTDNEDGIIKFVEIHEPIL